MLPRTALIRSFRPLRLPLVLLATLWLAGCDQLGIESTSSINARREAEGKAVGAGCRHVARSIEECYQLNRRADKAAVFAGWREMEDYMRENKLEAVAAPASPNAPAPAAQAGEAKADTQVETAAGAEPSTRAGT